jgi:ABC-2 type transport system permease protein
MGQNISRFNPIYYMVDGFRMGFLGSSTTGIVDSILVLLVMIILLSLLAFYLLKRGINIKT